MLAIMGCDNMEVISYLTRADSSSLRTNQTMPLYMHSALLIIRDMGVDAFNYGGKSVVQCLSCC